MEDIKEKWLELFYIHKVVSKTNQELDITRQKFEEWLLDDDFNYKYNNILKDISDDVEYELYKLINKGNLSAIKLYLEKNHNKYKKLDNNSNNNNNTTNSNTIPTIIFTKPNDN